MSLPCARPRCRLPGGRSVAGCAADPTPNSILPMRPLWSECSTLRVETRKVVTSVAVGALCGRADGLRSAGDRRMSLGEAIVSEDELHERIEQLGKEITADYEGRAPLLVGVLKGAFMFMSDLARAIELPLEVD